MLSPASLDDIKHSVYILFKFVGVMRTGVYASVQVNFWIGATDQSKEGGWIWTDGAPFRFLNWHPGNSCD